MKILPEGEFLKNFVNPVSIITTEEQEKFTQNSPSGVKIEQVNDNTYNLIIPKAVLEKTIGKEIEGEVSYREHWKKSSLKALRLKITTRGHFSFYTEGEGFYLAVQNIAQSVTLPVNYQAFTNTQSQSFYLYLSNTKNVTDLLQKVDIFLLDKNQNYENLRRCIAGPFRIVGGADEEYEKACEAWEKELKKIGAAAPKVFLNIIVLS